MRPRQSCSQRLRPLVENIEKALIRVNPVPSSTGDLAHDAQIRQGVETSGDRRVGQLECIGYVFDGLEGPVTEHLVDPQSGTSSPSHLMNALLILLHQCNQPVCGFHRIQRRVLK